MKTELSFASLAAIETDLLAVLAVDTQTEKGPEAKPQPELMLAGPVPKDNSWKYEKITGGHRYTSAFGSLTILAQPWRLQIRDAGGKLLTQTDCAADNTTSGRPSSLRRWLYPLSC